MHKRHRFRQTRAFIGRHARWTCGNCGGINPDITGTCVRCGQG